MKLNEQGKIEGLDVFFVDAKVACNEDDKRAGVETKMHWGFDFNGCSIEDIIYWAAKDLTINRAAAVRRIVNGTQPTAKSEGKAGVGTLADHAESTWKVSDIPQGKPRVDKVEKMTKNAAMMSPAEQDALAKQLAAMKKARAPK